ncbi:MAG: hypothetical protein MUP47_01640 [Phycisphaerae bacterium]|nr:hypothetical protein [Phycisphaerae bacterium]
MHSLRKRHSSLRAIIAVWVLILIVSVGFSIALGSLVLGNNPFLLEGPLNVDILFWWILAIAVPIWGVGFVLTALASPMSKGFRVVCVVLASAGILGVLVVAVLLGVAVLQGRVIRIPF